MQARPPERLVDVDVPEACRGPLVEEGRFERRAPTRKGPRERAAREAPLEWLDSEAPRREILVELARLEERPGSEAADVSIGDVRPVV
jgi:hypothetical protein